VAPSAVVVDPSGRFAYVANEFSDNVSGYTINATTGALPPLAGSPFPAGTFPQAITVDPAGRFVYVANGGDFESLGSVSGYTINAATGALTPVAGSPFPAGAAPSAVTVDPSGHFTYVANGDADNISGYAINATSGALTPLAGSPFPAGVGPSSVVITGTVQ
jgi:6-phosphogluconolactonase (cycloisomerase 2 family)